jgi:hypothetical protein
MMGKTPSIAEKRQKDAKDNFKKKLDALDKLIANGGLDRYPPRVSIRSFAAWKDPELGVSTISPSIIYNDSDDDYLEYQRRMKKLLDVVIRRRAKTEKKRNIVSDLTEKLEISERRAQSYVNQYSIAMERLRVANEQIEFLRKRR